MKKQTKKRSSDSDSDDEPVAPKKTVIKKTVSTKPKKTKEDQSVPKKVGDPIDKSQYSLYIQTTQSAAMKHTFGRLNRVVSECCIVFIKPSDSKTSFGQGRGGIRIIKLSTDGIVLIKLQLYADKFDYFWCEPAKIVAGVELSCVVNFLKPIKDNCQLIIYMQKNSNNLFFKSIRDVDNNLEEVTIEIGLIDSENKEDIPKPEEFQTKIVMVPEKLYAICKNFDNNATKIEIIFLGGEIMFVGKNDNGKITMRFQDKDKDKACIIENNVNGLKGLSNDDPSYDEYSDEEAEKSTSKKKQSKTITSTNTNNNVIIQGVYDLKYLTEFSKCNRLCQKIEMYLKNDFPLIIAIPVATLGKMYAFLAPIKDS